MYLSAKNTQLPIIPDFRSKQLKSRPNFRPKGQNLTLWCSTYLQGYPPPPPQGSNSCPISPPLNRKAIKYKNNHSSLPSYKLHVCERCIITSCIHLMAGLQLHNVTTCHTNSIKALENHTYILTPALQNCICKNKNYQLKAT